MSRHMNHLVGTLLAALGVALLVGYAASTSVRSFIGETVDRAEQGVTDRSDGNPVISGQGLVYLSESVVEVRLRSYTLGGLVDAAAGAGTGVIITERAPWTVLTASHVASEETSTLLAGQEIIVRRPGRLWGNAEVLEVDNARDATSLEVSFPEGTRVSPISVSPASTRPPEVGEAVATRCYFDDEIRRGTVIEIVLRVGGQRNILTDISVEPGCSGAPLVDAAGDLAGLIIMGSEDGALAVALDRGYGLGSPVRGGLFSWVGSY